MPPRLCGDEMPMPLDLSTFFRKADGFKVASWASVQQAHDKIKFDYEGRLEDFKSILAIDDVWSEGTARL